ncbi:MAG: DUF302 domain-containing protein [Candidatus Woesearchaeota archaeon]|jgi:uncharacterized protein (DUF302 family)|nr:DUF302 domain-containing protein [Candidatus Woesearchaeota archaeon]MDP7323155.1 DUF302 domain-containing protein [Candidatus Woesearchaeota archaeon]MDP7457889.1 DUF302 domain-containing protein [Candidatus Woesearchaeota archaeon]
MNIEYGIKKQVTLTYEEAVEKARTELKKEKFGILTEINVPEKLKEKLDVDVEKYIILGACHPPSAYKAFQAEQDIGLMLPCNVIVYEKDNKVTVAAIKPTTAMGMIDNPNLKAIANEVEEKLKKVVEII